METTTRSIIDRVTKHHAVPQHIAGNYKCTVYYDCYELSPNDLARLAADAVGHLQHDEFDVAVGVAYNGILFAAAIAGGRQCAILTEKGEIFGPNINGKKVIIVGDVVVTGKRIVSTVPMIEKIGGIVVGFACIVDRSGGKFHSPVAPLNKPLWSAFQTILE